MVLDCTIKIGHKPRRIMQGNRLAHSRDGGSLRLERNSEQINNYAFALVLEQLPILTLEDYWRVMKCAYRKWFLPGTKTHKCNLTPFNKSQKYISWHLSNQERQHTKFFFRANLIREKDKMNGIFSCHRQKSVELKSLFFINMAKFNRHQNFKWYQSQLRIKN